ncbi:alpha-protein kinase vwkA-like [Mercenaria mercenaria]|uniref:alpha-protein kinase vwkA-like n=1 Tax=Mercenaria mercenaria TaxID=6596 RepID=UPI00234EA498|nr:alpha-protein kinase vwkA-like [Mercenaria mercenaria]
MASFYPTKIAKKGEAKLDLAFGLDCTSSMDPYISEARDNIVQIVNEIVQSENCDVRLALVEYRDHPPADESFITQVHDFTESVGTMKKWLRESYAAGGGDIPEAVADALNDVLNLSWRKEATKICVFITDAPPHGLGGYRDKFPEGCPLGLDPMEISKQLRLKGLQFIWLDVNRAYGLQGLLPSSSTYNWGSVCPARGGTGSC